MSLFSPSLVQIFAKSRAELDFPDLQGIFFPASYGAQGLATEPGITCGMWQHRPNSRGQVRTLSTDLSVNPEIQPNYLGDETDRQTMLAGLKLARRLMGSDALRRYVDAELTPGPDVQTDDELLDYCYRTGSTTFHPVGTARMGPDGDPMAVVDPALRVRGLGKLRVVDASVMPTLVSGNTMAATLMLAARAGDLIQAERV
ncbi:GMC family oxidoreductase [Paracoccus sp. DMF]|uniref:GMC family oxidoreductase n=1 Tax=Paracoccus sp. DMF TaxID=400837 RepID=UPI0011037AF8|nr:GMC oxidoreductase [Paracoccus sp. DMF]